MARFFRKRTEMLGQRPGEMVYIGPPYQKTAEIHEIQYSPEDLKEKDGISLLEEHPVRERTTLKSWINVNGLNDTALMLKIREHFSLHFLTMADIMNTGLRPKMDELDTGFFLAMKMLRFDQEKGMILSEQLSMIITDTTLLTFQEAPGDVFDPVRKRLFGGIGRIRSESIQYLAYSLIDCIVDNYIALMQILADKIEAAEGTVLEPPGEPVLETILSHKKELLYLSKSIRPVKDVLKAIMKEANPLVSKTYLPYFRDLYSNITQVTETIELYKEICAEQLNSYNSCINNKLNDIMKFLTVFSVIFLPLTLITGIYGTNFEFMPELHFKYGYLFFWGLLICLAGLMIFIFKRKKWL